MFDLQGTDNPNEFVEIFNLSSTDTVDLKGWKIRDHLSLDDLVETGMGTKLAPRSYAVILEGDYDISSGIYLSATPDTVLLVRVDDLSIGNQLSTTDSLLLIDELGVTVDGHGWEDIYAPGFSLERRRLDRPSTQSNWSTSVDSLGTPGFQNSITPPTVDGAIFESSITHTPRVPEPDQAITLYVPIHNLGIQPVTGTIQITERDNILVLDTFHEIPEGDSVTVQLNLMPLSPGIHRLTISINVEEDSKPDNNEVVYRLIVRFTDRILTINEFHYSPESGIPEFIEVVNLSDNALDLTGWGVSDTDTATVRYFPEQTLLPGGYLVVSEDSLLLPFVPAEALLLVPRNGFPRLNDSGDAIYLLEPAGNILDSLTYTPDWGGGQGRSVEKLNPALASWIKSNWGTSVAAEKFTPGSQNSILLEDLSPTGSIIFEPNPFSPDGDGHEDVLRIAYELPFAQAYLSVLIFDSNGRPVRTLAKNLATGSRGILSWDGLTDRNRRARIGMYVLKIGAVEKGTKRSMEWVRIAVLAEPL